MNLFESLNPFRDPLAAAEVRARQREQWNHAHTCLDVAGDMLTETPEFDAQRVIAVALTGLLALELSQS